MKSSASTTCRTAACSTSTVAPDTATSASSRAIAATSASCAVPSPAATRSCTSPREKIPRYGGALKTLEANVAGANAALRGRAGARRQDRHRVHLRRLRQLAAAVRRGRQPDASARRRRAAGPTPSPSCMTSMSPSPCARSGPARLDPAPLRLLRPAQPPVWWGGPQAAFIEVLLDGRIMDIHGDGRQIRTFTYVTDTVDGFVRALDTPASPRARSSTSAPTSRRRSCAWPSASRTPWA